MREQEEAEAEAEEEEDGDRRWKKVKNPVPGGLSHRLTLAGK